MTRCQLIANAVIGMSSCTLSVITTFQEQLEWGVRFAGGLIGLIIGLITLYRIVRKAHK